MGDYVIADKIIKLTETFIKELNSLCFTFDGYIYNPFEYAFKPLEEYFKRYVNHTVKNVFLGMNPGPYGMMQTGIPFGEVGAVKSYLNIREDVSSPLVIHPDHPVLGLNCAKSEVSGYRLWGLIKEVFPVASDFFRENVVLNYCPLVFISKEGKGRNVTPDKLLSNERMELERACSGYLHNVLDVLNPVNAIGIGKYAEEKLRGLSLNNVSVYGILHPSPASPLSKKAWVDEKSVLKELKERGVW